MKIHIEFYEKKLSNMEQLLSCSDFELLYDLV